MTDLSHLKLFATHPHPCSYLDDEEATTLFIDPDADIDQDIYSQLSRLGFRRSGAHLYRPHCEHCQACVSCRIPVDQFSPNRSQRRCWRRNEDLELRFATRIDTEEHYQLYADYIETRHRDGDMYPPSREQYESFLSGAWNVTQYLEFRLEGRLMGVAVCDRLNDALSAVYTFFDGREQRRSLGVFAILAQVEMAKRQELKHLYLGYWVKQCQKMDYKTQYRPLELLANRRWVRIN